MGPDDGPILYNLACVYSVAGETDTALDCLQRAVVNGFTGRDGINHDTDLEPIRDTDRFKAILAQMKDAG